MALSFQDQIADFANGAVSAAPLGDVMRGLLSFVNGVSDRDRKLDPPHDRNVGHVVTDVRAFVS